MTSGLGNADCPYILGEQMCRYVSYSTFTTLISFKLYSCLLFGDNFEAWYHGYALTIVIPNMKTPLHKSKWIGPTLSDSIATLLSGVQFFCRNVFWKLGKHQKKTRGHEALNRSPEQKGQYSKRVIIRTNLIVMLHISFNVKNHLGKENFLKVF